MSESEPLEYDDETPDYHDTDDAAWYLHEACEYLADAADAEGWRGICFYATALLHYALARHYPAAACDMVVGYAAGTENWNLRKWPDLPVPGHIPAGGICVSRPYAHYWLELRGLNGKGEAHTHVFDCAELSSRRLTDPFDELLEVLPALFPDDLAGVPGALYFGNGDADDYRRDIFGAPPERLILDLATDPDWRPGMLRRLVADSDGLLVMPPSYRLPNDI